MTTGFGGDDRASRIARLLVLDMVLWPGALFAGVTLLVAWQVRGNAVALAALTFATLFSAAVGVRQWSVMLRAIFARPPAPVTDARRHTKEASPRLSGRGGTGERP